MANEIHIQAPVEQLERGKSVAVPVTLVLDRPLKVRGIHATFHGAEETQAVYTTTTTDGKGRVTTQTHTARPGNIESSFSQEFTLTAEATAPLSARGKLFSIDWFVQIELDVPWAKDPKIRAPIELLPV